jgi:hypothetical protein
LAVFLSLFPLVIDIHLLFRHYSKIVKTLFFSLSTVR